MNVFFKVVAWIVGGFVLLVLFIIVEGVADGTVGKNPRDVSCSGSICIEMKKEKTFNGERVCYIKTDKTLDTREVSCVGG